MREVKDENELRKIKKSCELSDETFGYIKELIRPGMTKQEVAWKMEKFAREQLDTILVFPTIVASGENTAFIHHRTSHRKIKTRDIIMIDFGL